MSMRWNLSRRAMAAAVALLAATSAHAAIISYSAVLSGPAESPPNGSPGTGFATVDYDNVLHSMHVHVDFFGLTGTTTASHIHAATAVAGAGTAGVATQTPTFSGFPALRRRATLERARLLVEWLDPLAGLSNRRDERVAHLVVHGLGSHDAQMPCQPLTE